jgi:opacity protein-like surface antigen
MSFKRLFFSFLVSVVSQIGSVFFAFEAYAQNTREIGFGLGGANYRGEVAPIYNFLNNRPAFTVFGRKDISAPITLRASLTAGLIRARDTNINLPLHQHRRAEVTTNFAELSAALEYNFLDYYDEKRRHRWTPYFMVGAAVANYNNRVLLRGAYKPYANSTILAIPVGLGVKYALTNNWNLGVEFGARKTFTDALDFLTNGGGSFQNVPEEMPFTNPYTNDWYYYNGISISYTFYKIRCPEKKFSNRRRKFLIF